jgi:hypothetical protein
MKFKKVISMTVLSELCLHSEIRIVISLYIVLFSDNAPCTQSGLL